MSDKSQLVRIGASGDLSTVAGLGVARPRPDPGRGGERTETGFDFGRKRIQEYFYQK
jgi:hypothetical protein